MNLYILTVRFQTIMDPSLVGLVLPSHGFQPRDRGFSSVFKALDLRRTWACSFFIEVVSFGRPQGCIRRFVRAKSLVISHSFMPSLRPILDHSRLTGGNCNALFEGARSHEA